MELFFQIFLCLGKIFLLLLLTVRWTFRFFPATVYRAKSDALGIFAGVRQQGPVDHLPTRPRWNWAMLLADEASTVLELKQGLQLYRIHICVNSLK